MKSLGIVRKIDPLGRIVLPMELRRTLGIKPGDPVEIYVDGKVVCLKTVKLQCVCCGSTDEDRLIVKNGVHMCPACVKSYYEEV